MSMSGLAVTTLFIIGAAMLIIGLICRSDYGDKKKPMWVGILIGMAFVYMLPGMVTLWLVAIAG